jgi:hypothetical protein
VAADAASGLRVKGAPQSDTTGLEWSPATGECPGIIDCLDLMLVSPEVAAFASPDVIIQIGPRQGLTDMVLNVIQRIVKCCSPRHPTH